MKFITREVTIYTYYFANVDIATGNATNLVSVSLTDKMTSREIKKKCVALNGAVHLRTTEHNEKYSLPLQDFVRACAEYAERIAVSHDTGDDYEDYLETEPYND